MIQPALADVGVRRQPYLPEVDVRHRIDDAVRRGWLEIGRRVARRLVLLAVDLGAIVAAVFVATLVRGWTPGAGGEPFPFGWHAVMFLLFVQPLVLEVFGAYGGGKARVEFRRVASAAVVAAALLSLRLQLPAAAAQGFGATGVIAYSITAILLLYAGRLLIGEAVTVAYTHGLGQRPVLVVGTESQEQKVVEVLGCRRGSEFKVVGRLSPSHVRQLGEAGTAADVEEALKATGARGVIVSSQLSSEAFETLVRRCFAAGASVTVLPANLNQIGGRVDLRNAPSGFLFELHPRGPKVPQLATKRGIDLLLSSLLLLVAWPVLLLIALAVKLDSRGPVFFKQRRAGVGGQPFWMYKFRTMVADADRMKADLQHLNETGDPRLFKIKHDPRITRVGRVLRKTSLDELPQIFNVLKGEMSLVGPRPFFPEDLVSYAEHHFERLSVLPGITGLWQVSGRSDIVDFEEVVRLDAEYIREWSVGRDLVILLKTVPAALGRGAY